MPSGETSTGHDTVHMGVVRQRRAPGVQYEGRADARAQVLGVGGDGQENFSGDIEQQGIHRGLVLVRDLRDGRGQREDDVVIIDREQIGLARLQPALRGAALALGAMPVAAGVVGDQVGAAALAAQHVPTQRRAAALFDGRHHLELGKAQVVVLGLAPGRPVGAEDVGDFQGGTPHADTPTPAAIAPAG